MEENEWTLVAVFRCLSASWWSRAMMLRSSAAGMRLTTSEGVVCCMVVAVCEAWRQSSSLALFGLLLAPILSFKEVKSFANKNIFLWLTHPQLSSQMKGRLSGLNVQHILSLSNFASYIVWRPKFPFFAPSAFAAQRPTIQTKLPFFFLCCCNQSAKSC